MILFRILRKSHRQRTGRSLLSITALALSVMLLLVISHVHEAVRQYARQVASQADLIVGAPTQPVHLVLYGLFGIGAPPPPIKWERYQEMIDNPSVDWAAPVSAGESHRGHTVIGSTARYLTTLQMSAVNFISISGSKKIFRTDYSAFIGSSVAENYQYQPGETITIARGFAPSLKDEYQTPFLIQGVLKPTGTNLDDHILVPMEGLRKVRAEHGIKSDHINFVLMKLKDRSSLFELQQSLETRVNFPLRAAIPAIELEKLGQYERILNHIFMVMSFMIGALALLMMFFNLSAGFAQRKLEIELLRMVGAKPWQLANIALIEPLMHILAALALGFVFYRLANIILENWIPVISIVDLPTSELMWLLLLCFTGLLIACIPAWRVFGISRNT